MSDAAPSLKQLNRTFIGSVLFIDIVGYSKRTVPDQVEMKELFNSLLAEAVRHVAPGERIMVDTGDGAAIAFLGDPEDALFAALSLIDAVNSDKVTVGEPGYVRMGINLGPLKMVRDINGHTNMIGDGVNDSQRVMSFAEAGQVMVSHSYYDIISRFSRDYTQLFLYEGTRHDKHVREHEVYRFVPLEGNLGLIDKLRERSRARQVADDDPVSVAATASRDHPTRPSAAQAKAVPRFALLATMIGAASVVGAVWSWTSIPVPATERATTAKPVPAAVALNTNTGTSKPAVKEPPAKQPEAAAATAPAASTAAKPAPGKAADKPATSAEKSSEAAAPGRVKLAVQPWGEVYVNGSKRGVSPPLKSLHLAPGKYRIEIRNGQFAPHKETVEVKSGAELTVQYAF